MNIKKLLIVVLALVLSSVDAMGSRVPEWYPEEWQDPNLPIIENMPQMPALEGYKEDLDGKKLRKLQKTYTVALGTKVNVFIPLEVMTDIDIEATIIGNQIAQIPFDIELNRTPEKKNYYSVKYSKNELDIDDDGEIDTFIYSSKYINDRVSKDNYVKIFGEKISRDGVHKKKVYVTIEVGE
ncbi:hypothetical protein [Cetobacterium sp.]|uniref:hypothetical protein n=1 Tax=Cetobacterium sp. TaxID=2071632 RepID=UPI003EE64E31